MVKWIMLWTVLLVCVSRPVQAGEAEAAARVRALQQAALAAASMTGGLGGMRVRLRLAALLPQVSISAGRGLSLTGNEKQVNGLEQLTLSDGDKVNYSLTAHWDLTRLLYAREELSMRGQEQRMARQRATLTAEVARLYYERRRLLRIGTDTDRIAELTATLDGLTGLNGLACLVPQDGP